MDNESDRILNINLQQSSHCNYVAINNNIIHGYEYTTCIL